MMRKLYVFGLIFFISVVQAETFDYHLEPKQITENTYVFIGAKEDFTLKNGGNIVNTGFILTEEGVIVIDTGPSYLYGLQMRKAIKSITKKSIVKIFITHHHPDHFLGNQAYSDVPIYALPETIKLLQRDAAGFLDNIYRMSGQWMSGTETYVENINPLSATEEHIGGHSLKYIKLNGHTDSDLVIFDETTGVVFAGDLVFHNRTPTTSHAKPEAWIKSLNKISNIRSKWLVPGHGEITENRAPIEQTYDYLVWLEATIKQSVADGMDMMEVLALPIPERFKELSVMDKEFVRSVSHRFPYYENLILD